MEATASEKHILNPYLMKFIEKGKEASSMQADSAFT
jgi:hypothetical protein